MFFRVKISDRVSFYIRLFLLIMIFCFLLIDLLMTIKLPLKQYVQLLPSDRVSHYYVLFTTQSNYIVAIYFSLEIIKIL